MNAESEMAQGDGLGAEPSETRGQKELRELAEEIGYSDGADGDDEGGVDALIDYKNALEDRLASLIDSRPANGVDAIVQEAGEIIATRGEVEDVPKLIEEIEEHYPDELYASFIAPGIDRMEEALQVCAGLQADAEKLVERIHALRHPREAKRFAFSIVVEAADADEAFEFMAAEVTNTWHTDPEAVFLSNPRPIRNIEDYDGDEVARAVIEGEPDV